MENTKTLLEDKFEKRLICNKCKTDKLYVFDIGWDTYIMCPECNTLVSVRGE